MSSLHPRVLGKTQKSEAELVTNSKLDVGRQRWVRASPALKTLRSVRYKQRNCFTMLEDMLAFR